MPVRDPKELFVVLLSNLRQGNERTTEIFKELQAKFRQHSMSASN